MSVSNGLQIKSTFALLATDRLEVRSVECSHMPWLDRDASVWPSVRAALESGVADWREVKLAV